MHAIAVADSSGWVTATVAVVVLILNMIGGAIRFETRMSRLEEQQIATKAEVDQLLRKSEQRRSTDWGGPAPPLG